jgi:hypothetical protein
MQLVFLSEGRGTHSNEWWCLPETLIVKSYTLWTPEEECCCRWLPWEVERSYGVLPVPQLLKTVHDWTRR